MEKTYITDRARIYISDKIERVKTEIKQSAEKSDMDKKIVLDECPYEIQKRILDLLDEKDHITIHRVSKSWRMMICQYMDDKTSIKAIDWKWFCKHTPQIMQCSQCLKQRRNKVDDRGLAEDWKWWSL